MTNDTPNFDPQFNPEVDPKIDPASDENFALDGYQLTEAEAAYIDALLGEGHTDNDAAADFKGQPPSPRLSEMIALFARFPEPIVPAGLAERTLAVARRHLAIPEPVFSGRTDHPHSKMRIGWDRRKTDFAAMAVAAGLMVAILISGISRARFVAGRTQCADNLAYLSTAFSGYAADYAGLLPSIAPPADQDWLPRSDTPGMPRSPNAHSNLANLNPLVAHGAFASWKRLICPSCQADQNLTPESSASPGVPTRDISYSYLDQLSAYHHHWGGNGNVVVMADYNPLFEHGISHVGQNSNSFNHAQRGENILSDDGTVRWVTSPNVGPRGDNIWTLQQPVAKTYTGKEEPQSPYDIILVP